MDELTQDNPFLITPLIGYASSTNKKKQVQLPAINKQPILSLKIRKNSKSNALDSVQSSLSVKPEEHKNFFQLKKISSNKNLLHQHSNQFGLINCPSPENKFYPLKQTNLCFENDLPASTSIKKSTFAQKSKNNEMKKSFHQPSIFSSVSKNDLVKPLFLQNNPYQSSKTNIFDNTNQPLPKLNNLLLQSKDFAENEKDIFIMCEGNRKSLSKSKSKIIVAEPESQKRNDNNIHLVTMLEKPEISIPPQEEYKDEFDKFNSRDYNISKTLNSTDMQESIKYESAIGDEELNKSKGGNNNSTEDSCDKSFKSKSFQKHHKFSMSNNSKLRSSKKDILNFIKMKTTKSITGDDDLEVFQESSAKNNSNLFHAKVNPLNVANAMIYTNGIKEWQEEKTPIGAGSTGQVYKALDKKTGKVFVVKKIPLIYSSFNERLKEFQSELKWLESLRHPNIVSYLGNAASKDYFCIFLELMSEGNLSEFIKKFGPLNENIIQRFSREILLGLDYLHNQNVIHRDLKPTNILVDSHPTIKLSDFACSSLLEASRSGESLDKSLKGTANYMSPEAMRQEKLLPSSDIWSFGCTLLEMKTGKQPWFNQKFENIYVQFMAVANQNLLPDIPYDVSENFLRFIQGCLVHDPKKRLTAKELLAHPFLAKTI